MKYLKFRNESAGSGTGAVGTAQGTELEQLRSVSNPPSLFDESYYLASNPDVRNHDLSSWEHFCRIGFAENRNPHPLFDTRFFRQSYLSDRPNRNPLLHYVEHPQEPFNTHPLLDVVFYVAKLTYAMREKRSETMTWLEFFLAENLYDFRSACQEFSSERFMEKHPEALRDQNPIFHFLIHGEGGANRSVKDWISVPPKMFDEAYYVESNEDLQGTGIDMWQHFCEYGFKESRNPHPVFHTAFYRKKYLSDLPDVNPLTHYNQQTELTLDTHPLFDASFYLSQIRESVETLAASGLTPLEHFIWFNRENLASPTPLFSTKRYLDAHPDIAKIHTTPPQ